MGAQAASASIRSRKAAQSFPPRRDRPPTPPETLTLARSIARANGLRFVYTGNVHDRAGGSTYCPGCDARVVERDWYRLGAYRLTGDGRCNACGTRVAGVFDGPPGDWGPRQLPVRLHPPAERQAAQG